MGSAGGCHVGCCWCGAARVRALLSFWWKCKASLRCQSAMCALGLGRCSCKVPLQSAAQSAAVRRLLCVLCSLGTDAIAAKCCCKMSCVWVLVPLQGAAAGCCCQSAAVRVLCVLWGLRLLECSVRLDLRYWCRRSSAAAGGKVLLQAVARCCCHSAACAVELARLCCGGCHCRVRTIRSRKSV